MFLATYWWGVLSLSQSRVFHSRIQFWSPMTFSILELDLADDDAFCDTKGDKKNPTKENYAFWVTLDYLKVICIITGFCLLRVQCACCLFRTWSYNPVCDIAVVSTATNCDSANWGLWWGSSENKQVVQVEEINFPKIKIFFFKFQNLL